MDKPTAFDPFGSRFPALDLEAAGAVCIEIPKRLIPFLLGAVNPLRYPDVWKGDGPLINLTTAQVENFMSALILREECNLPPECPECPECGSDQCSQAGCNASGHGGGIVIESEEDMGQVVTDVKIVDGKIRVFYGPCCWNDLTGVDLGAISGGGEDLDEPYAPPTGEDPNTYSACAKAWAIIDAIEAVLNACYDVVASNVLPWTWPGRVETALDMNLNDKWTVALIIDWMGLGLLITAENAFTEEDQEKSANALAQVLGNTAAGVPDEATYEAIKNAIHTRGLVYDGLIMTAIAALGRNNLDRIAKLGALEDPSRDCSGPLIINPIGHIYWSGTVHKISGYGSLEVLRRSSDAQKIWLRWSGAAGAQFTAMECYVDLVCAVPLSRFDIKITGDAPYGNWSQDYPPINYTRVSEQRLYPPGSTVQFAVPGVVRQADNLVASWTVPNALVGSWGSETEAGFSAPGQIYTGVPFSFDWEVEIIRADAAG